MNPIQRILQTQRLVYGAQTGMLAIFAAVVYFLITLGNLGTPDYTLANTFQMVILVLVPVNMGAGYFVFKSMAGRIDSKLSLEEKLRKYFVMVLIRSALLEVPGLFCCVAAIVTRDELFLAVVPIILFVFLFLRPSNAAITEDLQLKSVESKQLERDL